MTQSFETAKARNRRLFPRCSAFLDEMREAFGDDVKMAWASENGNEIGKRLPDGVRPVFEPRIGKK